MRSFVRLAGPVLFILALFAAAPEASGQTSRYVCGPCGLPCDSLLFDKAGICPKCGMNLVEQASVPKPASSPPNKKVAILVFDGVEIIDYTGPWEMFGTAGFDVYTVAETKTPVTTAMGMTVVPRYTFSDAPQPDVLVVPGGGVYAVSHSDAALHWVKDTTAGAVHTLSVCNGAFILAQAGLLDGLSATTTYGNLDRLETTYPKIKVVRNQRFVDNGKVITAAGLSAGIDGALHVIDVMMGEGTAQQVALAQEYDWHSRAGYVRATLADRLIPRIDLKPLGDWDIARTDGGTDRWEMELTGTSDLGVGELMGWFGKAFASAGKWTPETAKASAGTPAQGTSRWRFLDESGKAWAGTLIIQPDATGSRKYTARLDIAREGS